MIPTATESISFAEYLLLPPSSHSSEHKTELVDGEIVEMAEPTALHEDIIAFLIDALRATIQAQERRLVARAGVSIEILREGFSNARRPDVVVCDLAQWIALRNLTQAIFLAGNPPALVIEVVSPNNLSRDTVDKRQDYAIAGILEYWIVNPVEGYVLVLVLTDTNDGADYRELGEYRGAEPLESFLLPNLSLTAAAVLAPPIL